jgi:hypothetical protein
MEYFVTFTVLAAFGYFIYTRVRASQERRANRPEGGSGGGSRSNPNTHEK